jgi:hypothetical protein
LERSAQVAQARAELQKLAQRLDLTGHVLRLEVLHAGKAEIDADLSGVGIVAQLVLDIEGDARFHARQNSIEVVGRDLDEAAILDFGKRFLGLAAEIGHHAHHEGDLLHFNGVADFDVVGDMDARRPDALQLGVD